MGEAIYHGIISFHTREQANGAVDSIRRFLRQGEAAYADWQETRNKSGEAKERFIALTSRNQEVFKALDLYDVYDEYCKKFDRDTYLNCLAGQMSFPDDPKVEASNHYVIFSGETWHMASWDRIMEGMRKIFNGKEATYYNSEYGAVDTEMLVQKLNDKKRHV